jgi:hypothetical protein
MLKQKGKGKMEEIKKNSKRKACGGENMVLNTVTKALLRLSRYANSGQLIFNIQFV